MSRLADGDRDAFAPLFRALYPRAIRLAHVKLHHDDGHDAAQLILMKVFARASEFEPGKPVLPWFYALAANEIRTLERRASMQRKRAVAESVANDVPSGDDPEAQLLDRELRSSLAVAIDALDEESATAIASMLGEGTRPDIAAPAFRKRVSRAYARLRLLLGGADGR
jgi:RNA polymerase sigma-70 factor (ECF subfamily)